MSENSQTVAKSVVDIYYLSNSPSFLYKMLRSNSYVLMRSDGDAEELINEFKTKAATPISTLAEMAQAYAILAALTFKDSQQVRDFFATVKNIKYEWFAEFANLYLSKYNPPAIIQSVTVVPESQYTIVSP